MRGRFSSLGFLLAAEIKPGQPNEATDWSHTLTFVKRKKPSLACPVCFPVAALPCILPP